MQVGYVAALVELHRGLPRQGPGSDHFTRQLLKRLPALPAKPRIADLGCGSGAAALLLARHYGSPLRAVDASAEFITELRAHASRARLDHLIEPICADMAALDWPPGSVDLLWSEGAAYNLGFGEALRAWRPLLAAGGVAVVSELSWFAKTAPGPARDFWAAAYPGMASEQKNIERAGEAGFRILFTERLPSNAWWQNYYGPLRQRMRQVKAAGVMQEVLQETEQEMALFEKYSECYGYTFYVMLQSA
jgi:SAM-dependent methyltransferase